MLEARGPRGQLGVAIAALVFGMIGFLVGDDSSRMETAFLGALLGAIGAELEAVVDRLREIARLLQQPRSE